MGTSGPGLLYVTGPFVFGFDLMAGTRLTLKLGSVQLVNTQSLAAMPVTGQVELQHAQPGTRPTYDARLAPQLEVSPPLLKPNSNAPALPYPPTPSSQN